MRDRRNPRGIPVQNAIFIISIAYFSTAKKALAGKMSRNIEQHINLHHPDSTDIGYGQHLPVRQSHESRRSLVFWKPIPCVIQRALEENM